MPIPNEADATYADQSEIDKGDIQIIEQAAGGSFVLSGGVVTAQGTADGTVAVSGGTARLSASNKTISAGNVSVITGSANPDGSTAAAADATLARFSLITLNSSSQLGVLHGAPAALSPNNDGSYLAVYPVPTGKLVLAAIFIPPAVSTVSSVQIVDKRVVGSVDGAHDQVHLVSGSSHTGTLSVAQGLGKPQALTGAVSATNYVGATASVAPTTGTFAVGDFVITHTGKVYICTTAGTPGTWTQAGGSSTTVATDTIFDTKADLPVGTGADTAAKLAVGANFTHRLVPDSSQSTGLAWLPHIVRATADDGPIASDSTLSNDAALLWPISANSEIWFFQAWLYFTAADAAMDLKLGWSVPAGTTMRWGAVTTATGTGQGGWAAGTTAQTIVATLSAASAPTFGSVAGMFPVLLAGTVFGSTTAGDVVLQWSQASTVAANLTREDNSMLMLWRLA